MHIAAQIQPGSRPNPQNLIAPAQPVENQIWLRSSVAEIGRYLKVATTSGSEFEHELFQHLHVKNGQRIFFAGDHFDAIYLINSGFTKSVVLDDSGNEQIVNFQMKGDILGIDGIHAERHHSGAYALSECDLIMLPIKKLAILSQTHRQFEKALLNLISLELIFQQNRLCILAAKTSEARVASFLLNLSARFFHLGYSKAAFTLRMTRSELGSYLGLTLETVSRSLSVLNEVGLIAVHHRGITIRDEPGLKNLASIKKSSLK